MAPETQSSVDTIIVGNGPSSLILSYILHGHIPYYRGGHDDQILDQKLKQQPQLLKTPPDIYNHLRNSIKYSTQALPINTLIDTLYRPHADTSTSSKTCIEWKYEPERAIQHLVLGSATQPGGQWIDNPVDASWDIGALSYAEQLSLPGYTFEAHWLSTKHLPMPELSRPTRRDIAEYYAAYPAAVGITKSIITSTEVHSICRRQDGFHIGSHKLHCKHLVLASGVFSINLPPPRFLAPLSHVSSNEEPVLIIGSGFTAADIIISTPPNRKIIHMFNWDPEHRPSPLKACHSTAYPEYATVYRQMKLAALKFESSKEGQNGARPKVPRKRSGQVASILSARDWASTYEGLPNVRVLSTFANDRAHSSPPCRQGISRRRSSSSTRCLGDTSQSGQTATILLSHSGSDTTIRRTIGSFRYAVGRRGSLAFLSPPLLREVMSGTRPISRRENAHLDSDKIKPVNGTITPIANNLAADSASRGLVALHTLRSKLEDWDGEDQCCENCDCHADRSKTYDTASMEVAPDVFVIGSLTGDSLVRFALGGCVVVAGRIMDDLKPTSANGSKAASA